MPKRRLCMFLVLLAAAVSAPLSLRAADDVEVRLDVHPANVAAGGQFKLTVTVSGAIRSVGRPEIAGLENFTVVGTSQSSNFSMVGASINLSVVFDYTLFAGNEGTYTLGPASVDIRGTTYSSRTVEITVGQGAAPQPQPGAVSPGQSAPTVPQQPQASQARSAPKAGASSPDGSVFIQGQVDRREAYVGEQVLYTFGFYYRTRLVENPEYTPPTFSGFWVEQVDQSAVQSTREVNGVTYVVQELRYALFPTTAGEATVGPAGLAYVVSDIWNFFDRARRHELKTRPVTITVKPLPEAGRPENFNGAVGRFNISAKLDKSEVKQGEPITLEVTLSGSGNIKTLQEPRLAGIRDFDIYESKSEEVIERGAGGIGGRKVFRYVLVPRRPGNYGWDSIEYSFFDPRQGRYYSIGTEPVKFTVTPSEAGRETPGYRLSPEKVLTLGDDIRYIKEGPDVLTAQAAAPYAGGLFWAGHGVPLLSVLLALAWRRHRDRLLSDTGYARLRKSGRRLSANLKQASRDISAGRPADAYAALDRALVDFIGDKLNTPTRGMVTEQIAELLTRRNGLDPALVEEVRDCLERLAFARFAPASVTPEEAGEYLDRVKKLASRLDRAL